MKPASVLATAGLLCLLLGTPLPGQAVQIWAIWELDLGGHAPPTSFVLTVASPTGVGVPPPMTVPYAACTTVPNAPRGSHCAPVGCPPAGTYAFVVQAQYPEGLSAPSNLATCTLTPLTGCTCVAEGLALPPPSVPLPSVPVLPVLVTTPPPLPQQTAEGLNLLPLGALPPLPAVPPLPQTAAT
jgi:hypothetical protein